MSSIQTISKQFALQTRLFNNVLEGIEDNKGSERLNDHVNHLQWIAGHLTNSRYSIASMLDISMHFPFKETYTDFTAPPPFNRHIDASVKYPSLTEIKKYWNSLGDVLVEKLSNLGEEKLASASPFAVPIGKTLLDMFSFIASHESYHIGQMSIIRKYLGLEAMSYK
jgi:hypothetical protein